MDSLTFLDGIALGRGKPGPIVITSTFIGYLQYGLMDGLVATVAIFLPSFLIIATKRTFAALEILRFPKVVHREVQILTNLLQILNDILTKRDSRSAPLPIGEISPFTGIPDATRTLYGRGCMQLFDHFIHEILERGARWKGIDA